MVWDGGSASESPLLCHAPFVTIEFDPFGDALACCANVLFPLGNVTRSTVDEIWRGPRAQMLRAALRSGDLSLGCTICRHRIGTGDPELPLEGYRFELPEDEPGWPTRLSFSLHNTCNLECVMCGADRSSRIRSRRGGLPPLPHVYGDAFFEQIQPYLEHCRLVDFVGGEPFLVREHWRIWDDLVERGMRPRCGVTTNGTVWNDRVEEVLEHFETDVRISIDGLTPATFEAVRTGATHAEVFANLERFRTVASRRGTQLVINWSFLRHNWFELADMLVWAEERGLPVNVITVNEPAHGAQKLPTPELEAVLDGMRRRDAEMAERLNLNLPAWNRQVAAIAAEMGLRQTGSHAPPCMEPPSPSHVETIAKAMIQVSGRADAGPPPTGRLRWASIFRSRPRHPEAAAHSATDRADRATARLRRWEVENPAARPAGVTLGRVATDRHGRIRSMDLGPSFPLPPDARPAHLGELLSALTAGLGGHLWLLEQDVQPDLVEHTLFFGEADRDKVGVVVRASTFPEADGVGVLLARDDWFTSGPGHNARGTDGIDPNTTSPVQGLHIGNRSRGADRGGASR